MSQMKKRLLKVSEPPGKQLRLIEDENVKMMTKIKEWIGNPSCDSWLETCAIKFGLRLKLRHTRNHIVDDGKEYWDAVQLIYGQDSPPPPTELKPKKRTPGKPDSEPVAIQDFGSDKFGVLPPKHTYSSTPMDVELLDEEFGDPFFIRNALNASKLGLASARGRIRESLIKL